MQVDDDGLVRVFLTIEIRQIPNGTGKLTVTSSDNIGDGMLVQGTIVCDTFDLALRSMLIDMETAVTRAKKYWVDRL